MFRLSALVLSALFLASAVAPSVAEAQKKPAAKKKDDKKKKDEKKKGASSDRPGDQQASTKGLEATLKKTEVPVDTRRLAPAKLPDQPGKEVTRDSLADQRRDEAIEQIKKILPKQKNPEVRADLLFQLAELWWEKSRFVYIAEEMPAFEAELQSWNKCQREKGEKACPGEPRINNRKSELYRQNAVDLYAQVIKEYPQYKRVDEIRFILAYNKYELATSGGEDRCKGKNALQAIEQYRTLIALHPKSPFVSDSYVQLGNFYFDCNDLRRARDAFEAAVKINNPKTVTYAIYKVAWCDINSGDYEAAKRRLKDVVSRAEKSKDDRIRLKEESLRDLVKVFAYLDEMDTAIRYYQEKAGMQGSRRYIKNLAEEYFGMGGAKYDMAIKMFKYMIDEHRNDPNAPEWQSRVVLAFDKKGLSYRPKVLEEMRVLVNNYKPGSPWYVANKTNQMAIDIAYSLTEEALYNLVTDYHQEAIKTKSVATYRLARDIYREYIENFPSSERAYQMRFYYAEILYALEEFQAGYEQYVKVAYDKERDDYKRQSATNMLLAAEKLVDMEAGRFKRSIDDASTKIDEKKDKGVIEQKQIVKIDKNAQPQELTELEKQLVKACDQYAELIPNAEDEARVRLRGAVIYFDRVQYVEAGRRFSYIISKWPEEKTSATAASLILEGLETKEEWADLNKLSREFNDNKKLLAGAGKEEFRKKLAVYIEGSQFKIASETNEERKDYPLAAKQFREFVAEFPQSRYSPIALYNAFVIYQRAKQLDTAIEMGEKLLAEYKDCDKDEWKKLASGSTRAENLLPLIGFDLAKLYEQIADFATASRYYEKFATDFPADKRAPDAQFNAALWLQGLGETDKAIAAFGKYVKIYNERKKSMASKPEEFAALKLPSDATIAYSIGLIHENNRDWMKMILSYEDYLKNFPSDEGWKKYAARYKQMVGWLEMNKPEDGLRLAQELVEKYKSLNDADKQKESTKLAVAHSRFLTLEKQFDTYTKLRFESPRTFKEDLKRRNANKKDLETAYKEIIEYKNGDWAIASLVRIAMLPKLYAKSLIEAPIPKGLDFDQEEMYRALLEEEALKWEQPAIEALEIALAKSFELRIYNKWTLEAEALLAEFKPDLFADVKELPLKGSEFFFTAGQTTTSGGGGDAE